MENTSGLAPVGHAILVKPYEAEKITKGGIYIPDPLRERDQLAEQRAIVVEIGPSAWHDEPAPRAAVGDKVLITKYAGYNAIGPADGQTYRVINDRDIFVRITEENENE